jgi:hypothetical protein
MSRGRPAQPRGSTASVRQVGMTVRGLAADHGHLSAARLLVSSSWVSTAAYSPSSAPRRSARVGPSSSPPTEANSDVDR